MLELVTQNKELKDQLDEDNVNLNVAKQNLGEMEQEKIKMMSDL